MCEPLPSLAPPRLLHCMRLVAPAIEEVVVVRDAGFGLEATPYYSRRGLSRARGVEEGGGVCVPLPPLYRLPSSVAPYLEPTTHPTCSL